MIRFGSHPFRHFGPVETVICSPDGRLLASSSIFGQSETVVWDVASGERVFVVPQPSGNLSFSPEGRALCVAYSYTTVWSVPSGAPLAQVDLQHPAMLGAHGLLVGWSAEDGCVRAMTQDDGRVLASVNCAKPVGLTLSRDGALIAMWTEQDSLEVMSLPGFKRVTTLRGGSKETCCALFFPDSHVIVAAVGDSIRLWSLPDGALRWSRCVGERATSLSLSPSADRLIVGERWGKFHILRAADGTPLVDARLRRSHDVATAFVDDKTFVVAEVNSLVFYDAATARPINPTTHHLGELKALAVVPETGVLATASVDHSAALWRLSDGAQLTALFHENAVGAIALSPDGKLAATSGADDVVKLWRTSDAEEVARFRSKGSVLDSCCVAFSPDGRFLACDASSSVHLVDLREHPPRKRPLKLAGALRAVAFLTAQHLAVLREHSLCVVDIQTGDRVVAERPIEKRYWSVFAASSLGQRVAVVDGASTIVVFRTPELLEEARFTGSIVLAIALSTDGLLAGANADGSLTVWDVETHETAGQYQQNRTTALTFADGQTLVVGLANGVAETLYVPPPRRLKEAIEQRRLSEVRASVQELLRVLARRLAPQGYRDVGTGRDLDRDGLGIHFEGEEGPIGALRFAVDGKGIELRFVTLGPTSTTSNVNANPSDSPGPPKSLLRKVLGFIPSRPGRGWQQAPLEAPPWLAQVFTEPVVLGSHINRSGQAPIVVVRLSKLPDADTLERWYRRACIALM